MEKKNYTNEVGASTPNVEDASELAGKYLLSHSDDGREDYTITYIEKILDGNVYERCITVSEDYIDIDDEPFVHLLDMNDYQDNKTVGKEVADKVIQEVMRATSEIENLINENLIGKRPFHKGDCVVDRGMKSLCLGTDDILTYCCYELSFHPSSFFAEDAPMSIERWNDLPNVNPSVFALAEKIWVDTNKSLKNYLRSIYNSYISS